MVEKKSSRPLLAVFGAAFLFVCVALVTYFAAHDPQRQPIGIPPMPALSVSPVQSEQIITEMKGRVDGFNPTDEERQLQNSSSSSTSSKPTSARARLRISRDF